MKTLGAVHEDGEIRHFGQPPTASPAAMLAVADHLAVIRVTGADAGTFLQGQVSTDVRDISAGGTHMAMHLSLKGRGLVGMRVLPDGDGGFLLLLPAAMVDSCLEKLGKFVLLSKAQLSADADQVALVITGGAASGNLLAAGLHPPEAGAVHHVDPGLLAGIGEQRYLLILPRERAASIWTTLAGDLPLGGGLHARLDEILAGEGQVYPGGEDRFMPQELNYDLTGGISFKKGCYVGQEVVARMHFKGKLKQRMRHLSWPEPEQTPSPGTPLRDHRDKAVAEVVNAVVAGERCHALAVLRHGHDGPLSLDGRPLDWRLESLPYDLPEE